MGVCGFCDVYECMCGFCIVWLFVWVLKCVCVGFLMCDCVCGFVKCGCVLGFCNVCVCVCVCVGL